MLLLQEAEPDVGVGALRGVTDERSPPEVDRLDRLLDELDPNNVESSPQYVRTCSLTYLVTQFMLVALA